MSDLSKENQILLHLLKRCFRPDTPVLSEREAREADWDAVMKEAAHQAVLPMAFDAAAAYKKYIAPEVYQKNLERITRRFMINLRISAAQQGLTAFLEGHGYPYVIIKGEAAAKDYPRPELRLLGDVDFLIPAARQAEIADALSAAGYVRGTYEQGHHIPFRKGDIPLEMHFEAPGIPKGRVGEVIRAFLEDTLASAQRTGGGAQGFYMPDPVHHGLILLLHMGHHMIMEGIGLRHLCDWAAFVGRTAEDPFWQEKLLPILHQTGLLRYAAVMTQTCADAFGTPCPEWAGAEADLCREVLLDILQGGNFGRKDEVRSKAGAMIPERGGAEGKKSSLLQLWKTLHQATYSRYPMVRKYRILHPFFDLYRAGVYACRSFGGKRPSVVKMASAAQERRSVYERLEMFETEQTDR